MSVNDQPDIPDLLLGCSGWGVPKIIDQFFWENPGWSNGFNKAFTCCMCPLSGRVCRCYYITAIAVATFLLVVLLGGCGVATKLATEKTSRKIFMSANETYNIVAGDQSAVLQRVCMEVDNTATS